MGSIMSIIISVSIMFAYNYYAQSTTTPPPPEVPIGTIVPYAGTDIPDGWIACDNASYPTTTYPKLYDAIGYTYGMDGKNYRVPDTRGVFMRGMDSAALRDTNRPAGSIQLSVSMDYLPTGMIMIWYPPVQSATSLALAATSIPDGWAICDGTKGTPDLRGRFVLMASDSPAPVPWGAVHPIKSTGGEERHQLSIGEMPSHSHGGVMRHPGGQVEQDQSGQPEGPRTDYNQRTDGEGGNQSHNTMPPFYTLIYIMRV